MGALIILGLTAAVTVMAAYISSLLGLFLAALAVMATWLSGVIALVLLI
jgi:hypothetical protein